jgi:hypothetical protein
LLKDWSVGRKMLAVVAVPAIVLAVLLLAFTVGAVGTCRETQKTALFLELADDTHDLVVSLQSERDAASNFLHSFAWAVEQRDTREVQTDSALGDVESAVAACPDGQRGEADAAWAELNAILTTSGVAADGDFVDSGDLSDGSFSLAALRGIDVDVEPIVGLDFEGEESVVGYEDWPSWPDADTMRHLEDGYSRLQAAVDDLADRAPIGGGVSDAIDRLGEILGIEAHGATTFLLSPETYVSPTAETGGVPPPVPDMPGTYQEAFLEAVAEVDTNLTGVRAELDRTGDGDDSENTRALLAEAFEYLDGLQAIRDQVRQQTATPVRVSGWYKAVISTLLESQYTTVGAVSDGDVAEALTAFAEIETLVEAIRAEEVMGMRVIRQRAWGDPDSQEVYIGLKAQTDAALGAAKAAAGRIPEVIPLPDFGASWSAADNMDWQGIRSRLTMDQEETVFLLGWEIQIQEEVELGILPSQQSVWARAERESQEASSAALEQAILIPLGSVAVLAVFFFVFKAVTRRTVGPLSPPPTVKPQKTNNNPK